MALAAQIRNRIHQLPEGKTFGYDDLRIAKEDYSAAAKALERLQKAGIIKKVSKGVFYKPEKTAFGELQPDYSEQLRPYLFENGKRIAYETGVSLYRRLGLTTQMAFTIHIASRGKRIKINRGALKANPVKSYTEVTDSNYEILGLLDAFKDIKKIPDTSIAHSVKRLSAILKELDKKQKEALITYAKFYPSRVRALVGAILQNIGYNSQTLDNLKHGLNPLSTIKIRIKESELPTKNNWYIK
jgi:predicted transcriptional regulator of viral defense system